MIKGWRNDPKWVEFYRLRDERRIQREIERMKMMAQMQALSDDIERSLRTLERKPLTEVAWA